MQVNLGQLGPGVVYQHPINQITQTVRFVDDNPGIFLQVVIFQFTFQ